MNTMTTDRTIEILSPAGSADAFRAAVRAGADAVYVGGSRFGARAYADNFNEEELVDAIHEAHFYGRKLYLTVNTLLKETEIHSLYEYLAPYYESGLDAVIVQDMGVAEYIRTCFPGLDIHASTQMTITGVLGAKFVQSQGMTRVVPARELSLEEIRQIREQTDLEIECFVHGALCYCYSGQCLLSSMIGGRSGNRGQCAQPCRLPYTFNDERKYYLSPKDICTLELIPDLIEAGIDSFKIEGRMKKPAYVAGVTSLYRKYTDLYLRSGRSGFHVLPEDREMLMDLYNRGGSSSGYYKTRNGKEMMSLNRPNHAGVPVVKVLYQKGREVHGTALTDLNAGDVIETAGGKSNYTFGNAVKKGMSVSFLVQKQVRLTKGMTLNRIRNESLLQHIKTCIIEKKLQRAVCGVLNLRIGECASLRVDSGGSSYQAFSAEPVQPAQNRPMDRERICAQIKKTGNSEFYFESLSVNMDDNLFIPVQQLNMLRRAAFEGLKEEIFAKSMRKAETAPAFPSAVFSEEVPASEATDCATENNNQKFTVCVETEEQLEATAGMTENGLSVSRIYLDGDLLIKAASESESDRLYRMIGQIRAKKAEIFAALPHIYRSTENHLMEHILDTSDKLSVDGMLVRSCGEFQFLRECGFDKTVILDHNLYVFNRYAKKFWNRLGVTEFTAPLELTVNELDRLGLYDCELEIYGSAPVMVSAQCLFKTSGQCRKKSSLSILTDRYGNRFPVKSYCSSCYNVIYNDRPLCLIKYAEDICRLNPRRLRIRFTTESFKEAGNILESVTGYFGIPSGGCGKNSSSGEKMPERYTEGHFRKGIL